MGEAGTFGVPLVPRRRGLGTRLGRSKLEKRTSKILNDLQLIVRSYKYLNICNPPLKMNG